MDAQTTATEKPELLGVKATPIAFVRAIAQAYDQAGLSVDAALAKAQIPPHFLQQDHATVSAAQFEVLSEAAMRTLDDEALGWFERRLPWGSYGLLARASLSAPTLAVAMKRWCRHHGLLTSAVSLALLEPAHATTGRHDTAQVILSDLAIAPALKEFCEVTLLRNLLGFSAWIIDSRIALHQVDFSFPAPAHVGAYAVLFPCPVRFNAPATRLCFDASYLSLPVRRDESALGSMLQRALPLTIRHYRRDRRLVQQVQQILRTPSAAPLTAEQVAGQLNISSRSLFRMLREVGENWQDLKHHAAMARAHHALMSSTLPIKRVAEVSGFQNEKSFIRAFKVWAGVTPAAYRSGQGTT